MLRHEIKNQIFALQPGDELRLPVGVPTFAQYVRATCAGRGLTVNVGPDAITVRHKQETTSFRQLLIDRIRDYVEPFQIDGKSEGYTRAIVSQWNAANVRQFSVVRVGPALMVCDSADRKSIKQPEPVVAYTEPKTPSEALQIAVDLMRSAGLSGDEMRSNLERFINENDDLL